MYFQQVLIMGANKVACDCVNLLKDKMGKECLFVLETADERLSMLGAVCKKNGVFYSKRKDSVSITSFLESFIPEKITLIISANNRYIFPKRILNSRNILVINFHYALLPDYRGMNIPSWVIFNNENKTGITWHVVDDQIDHGEIIAQRQMMLTEKTTAFDIVRWGMNNAVQLLGEFIDLLLTFGTVDTHSLDYEQGKIYYNNKIPLSGVLDLSASIDVICRTLRAYDYKGLPLLPRLKIVDGANEFDVLRYEIKKMEFDCNNREVVRENDSISICEKGTKIRIILSTRIKAE